MSTLKGTIVVTGANGALGSAIAQRIASKPELSAYHGVYTVRDAAAAPALTSALGASAHPHDVVSLDLTDLENVRQAANDINARVSAGGIPPIRALILAAGFQDFGKQSWTTDGLDTTFAANYLGHFLLTLLLLQSIDKEAGRVVVIGSQGHDPDDPRNTRSKAFADEKYRTIAPSDAAGFDAVARGAWSAAAEDASFRGGFRRYGAAKLFLVMMQHELQGRLGRDATLENVSVLGVDPGTMISGLQRLAPWFIRVVLFGVVYPLVLWLRPEGGPVRSAARSAGDVLEAAVGAVGVEGGLPRDLYFDGRVPLETSAESRDVGKRKLVWSESVRYAGLEEGDTVLGDWQ
ncbi:hypothetical protein VPNG_02333 [Cytospora leucostoma]|uniref:Ketoreductase (KR) domain-containing protein n=1 Tax=Cytospora leucostoma TaxID=1230097 RepID=A0A423XGX3_9PEZI|nr:hypothetical protein VPNG_02333 [Cytospora leucostoma]